MVRKFHHSPQRRRTQVEIGRWSTDGYGAEQSLCARGREAQRASVEHLIEQRRSAAFNSKAIGTCGLELMYSGGEGEHRVAVEHGVHWSNRACHAIVGNTRNLGAFSFGELRRGGDDANGGVERRRDARNECCRRAECCALSVVRSAKSWNRATRAMPRATR